MGKFFLAYTQVNINRKVLFFELVFFLFKEIYDNYFKSVQHNNVGRWPNWPAPRDLQFGQTNKM